jgi:glyoxylase-like metal-dependent hydrolase (beta-lactamase superfamily II)
MPVDRRHFLRAALAGAVSSSLTRRVFAQGAPPPIAATRLASDVVLFAGDGGNIAAVVGNDGLMLVDGGLAERSTDLMKLMSTRLEKSNVLTLFNTHWHFDHVGCNEPLGKGGAKIIAHENTKKHLTTRTAMEVANRTFDPLKPEGIPSETFLTEGRLKFGTQSIEYVHIPQAHTDGDAYLFFPSINVLHTGDLMFNGTFPVIDYSNGGWIGGMAAAAEALGKVGDARTRIIPGHGPLATKDDLKATHDMLATIHDRVAAMIKAGKTLDEAVAAKPTQEFDAKYGQGIRKPDAFVQVAYTSILRHNKM